MLRLLANCTARACLAGAWLALLAWLAGLLASDRFLWSQFLWWTPTPIAAAAAALLLALAWTLERAARLQPRRRAGDPVVPPRIVRWSRLLALSWCCVAALVLELVLYEMRAYRVALPRPDAPTQPLRLVNWNINTARIEDVPARISRLAPDVFLMANRPYFGSFADLRKTVGEKTSVAAAGRLAVISKYPVLAYKHMNLDVTGAKPRTHRWDGGGMVSIDKGEALLVLLDTSSWNRGTTCIWFVDIPSDLHIPRARAMREARATIENFPGPPTLPREFAGDAPLPADDNLRAALLKPDIIAGDFNTPIHSHSIANILAPGLTPAPDLAGWGWRRTFPAGWPLIAIDNTLLAPTVRCTYYGVEEISSRQRDHLAQLTVLAPATN